MIPKWIFELWQEQGMCQVPSDRDSETSEKYLPLKNSRHYQSPSARTKLEEDIANQRNYRIEDKK